MVQPLREAIRTAIAKALEARGCCLIEVESDAALRVSVSAAVDGSIEVLKEDQGPRAGLLRRSRKPLDRYEMAALGFEPQDDDLWALAIPGHSGAAERAAAALDRLFGGPLEQSLDEPTAVWLDYPGLVPGRPVPPPDAPHAEHLQAAMAIFDFDMEAAVVVMAGLPSSLYLKFRLAGDDRVEVHVGGSHGEPPPPIAGYTPSPEVEGALYAEADRETFPQTASALLHDNLGVGEREPLFIYLDSEVVS